MYAPCYAKKEKYELGLIQDSENHELGCFICMFIKNEPKTVYVSIPPLT